MRSATLPAALLLAYLLITLSYSVVNPLFEAPDEHNHFFVAQFVATQGRLPQVTQPPDAWLKQEAAQPPLYYLLASPLLRLVDSSDATEALWLNPYVQMGDASSPTNLNRVIHSPAEDWPWQGYVLGAHLVRLLSTLFGFGTLLVIYSTARRLWPQNRTRALLALGIPALLPQFNFIHSYINNDSAVIFFAALTLAQLIGLWQSGEMRLWRRLLLGATVAAAILSKTTGLLLLGYTLLFLLCIELRRGRRTWQLLWPPAIVLLTTLLLAGWLPVRNWLLYRDITAANQFVLIAGGDRGYSLWQALAETSGIWRSLFGVFGWFNVLPPFWFYLVWNLIVLLALAGIVRAMRRPQPLTLLLALWPLIVFGAMLLFMLRTPAAQGRLLYPALLPLLLGLVFGLERAVGRLALPLVLPTALLTTLFVLLGVIAAAYRTPATVVAEPQEASSIERALNENVTLVAAAVPDRVYNPGNTVWVDIYWRSEQKVQEAPQIVYELFGRDNRSIAKLQSFHGGGLYPANYWPPNEIIHEKVGFRIDETTAAPVAARLNVLLVGSADVDIGFVEIEPQRWPQAATETPLTIVDGKIALLAAELQPATARPGETITVRVQWQVLRAPMAALTTLIHVGAADRPPLAQGDSPPLAGAYGVEYWQAGEIIEDSYTVTLPPTVTPGSYPIRIGMYDRDVKRLPLSAENDDVLDNSYTIATLEIAP